MRLQLRHPSADAGAGAVAEGEHGERVAGGEEGGGGGGGGPEPALGQKSREEGGFSLSYSLF